MRNYHTSKAIKRIGRVVMVFVMVAAMLTCAVPVHADAKAKTVSAARKYHLLGAASKKQVKEYKALPSVKIGKTTVKVSGIGKSTKKATKDGTLNGYIGSASYDYYTFVKFKAPSKGYYYFTFDNLKVNGNKDAVYSIFPQFSLSGVKDSVSIRRQDFKVCGERVDYTEDYTFKDGYVEYDSGSPKEITTANYKSAYTNYLDTVWEAYYRANNPDADAEEIAAEKQHHKYVLNRAINGRYDKFYADERDVVNCDCDTVKATYRTYEKLDKGEEILFIFTNPCEFKWNKTYDEDSEFLYSKRVVSKASYTIDLTIKKK